MVICLFSEFGCNWEGRYGEYKQHIDICDFASSVCEYCGERVRRSQAKAHSQSCMCMPKPCPLAPLGCKESDMSKDKLQKHLEEANIQHVIMLATHLQSLEGRMNKSKISKTKESHSKLEQQLLGVHSMMRGWDMVEADGAGSVASGQYDSGLGRSLQTHSKTQFVARLQDTTSSHEPIGFGLDQLMHTKLESMLTERMTETVSYTHLTLPTIYSV